MPKVFVPGPSGKGSFGSPATYIAGLQSLSEQIGRENLAKDRNEQTKLFQDAQIRLEESGQLWEQAAPERKEEERVATLTRDVKNTQMVENYAQGAQYSGLDRMGDKEVQDIIRKDPRYKNATDQEIFDISNQYKLENPSAFTSPKIFSKNMKAGLLAEGTMSGKEIDAAITAKVGQIWPTMSKESAEKMTISPDKAFSGKGGANITIGGRVFGGGGNGSFRQVSDPTNAADLTIVLDNLAGERALPDNPTYFLGTRMDFEGGIPWTSTDLTRQDFGDIASKIQQGGEVYSPTAIRAGIIEGMTGEGNLRSGFDWRNPEGIKKFTAAAKRAQVAEERLYSSKTGGGPSATGAIAGQTDFASKLDAINEYNEKIWARTVPQAKSSAQLAEGFLAQFGDTPRQGGDTGSVTTPQVATEVDAPITDQSAGIDPTAAVDPLFAHIGINPSAAPAPLIPRGIPAPVVAQEDKDFPIPMTVGGPIDNTNPLMSLADFALSDVPGAAGKIMPAISSLKESLTLPGPGILNPRAVSGRVQRQRHVDSLQPAERAQALSAARKLSKQGKIGLQDGEGNSADESLLIAYFEYLKENRK